MAGDYWSWLDALGLPPAATPPESQLGMPGGPLTPQARYRLAQRGVDTAPGPDTSDTSWGNAGIPFISPLAQMGDAFVRHAGAGDFAANPAPAPSKYRLAQAGYDTGPAPTAPTSSAGDTLAGMLPGKGFYDLMQAGVPVFDPMTGNVDPRYTEASTKTALGMIAGGAGMAPENALGATGGRLKRLGPRPAPSAMEELPPIGHNQPPPEFAMPLTPLRGWQEPLPAPGSELDALARQRMYPRQGDFDRMTDVPSLRGMPVDEAVARARNNPHLIEGGASTKGAFVGGPPGVQSMDDLLALRDKFDQGAAAGERGGRWYDRYREAINEVTGGAPLANTWMARLEAQYSPSAQPETELGFALGENNAAVAGDRRKTGRIANFNAFTNALNANDPMLLARGAKTGEYGEKINPDLNTLLTATGVNDFRHAQQFGLKKGTSLGSTQHKFLDYETANAVDRANAANLGGRSDWTGEQLQAAGWVEDKAQAFMRKNPNLPYEEAFARANTTIADFFDKHTAYMTHEVLPGNASGHLPGLQAASDAEKDAYALDPRASWAIAPGNRDAIYSSFERQDIPGVGYRVRPTTPYQGVYQPPTGPLELNKGMIARPLVSFENAPGGGRVIAGPDRRALELGETLRGSVDAQNAEAGHAVTFQGPGKGLDSLSIENPHGPLTREQAAALRTVGAQYGLPDIVDRSSHVTMTNFGGAPPGKQLGAAIKQGDILQQLGDQGLYMMPHRASIGEGNSVYQNLVPLWRQGEGSGAITRNLLAELEKEPTLAGQLDVSKTIPQVAANKRALDAERAGSDTVRPDLQNLREIIGEGPGWQQRLRDALASGKVSLPSLLLPGISLPYLASREDR